MALITRMLILAALAVCSEVQAADYPTKAVTMIVPYPPGGRTDITGRIFAQSMQETLGKPVAVVNRAGASGVLGANEVAAAHPDGYMLGYFSSGAVSSQYTVPTPLDMSKFELIAIVNADPAAIAVPASSPWKSLKDLVDEMKAKPGVMKMATSPGASSQLFAGGFVKASGLKVINVPFKGDADSAIALAGKHVDAAAAVPVAFKSLVESQKVRVLAIAADSRSALYGDIPTFKENGVDLTIGAFHGVFVPAGTPEPIKTRLADALTKAAANPELNKRMEDVGAAVMFLKGEEAKDFFAKQDLAYRDVIEDLGLRPAKK